MAFSPRTTSLTVVRPRAQKPADERFFEKLESEVRHGSALLQHVFDVASVGPLHSMLMAGHGVVGLMECPVAGPQRLQLAAWFGRMAGNT